MERLTMTDTEMEEIRQYAWNFNCPIKAEEDSTTQKFCNLVCDEFQYDCPFEKVGLKLKSYEDAEENGMLIHLPCRVGDTVYLIDHSICRNRKKPLKCIIDEFTVDQNNECYAVLNGISITYALRRFKAVNIKEFGKTVFLTNEDAEQALKQKGE